MLTIIITLVLLLPVLGFMILVGIFRGVNKSRAEIYIDQKYNEMQENRK